MPNKLDIAGTRVPIISWCKDLEEGALAQAINLSNLPFVHDHIAIMPDAHQGYGMPIGGVIACINTIIPNAVGVDIGCGVRAVKTSNTSDISTSMLNDLMHQIRHMVPMGFKHHKKAQKELFMPEERPEDYPIVNREYRSALTQIGTLGGGNHFIEVQRGSDGFIWLMLHSGSRNLGKQVADHYNKLAKQMNSRMKSEVPLSWDLAYLPMDTEEAANYKREMLYCCDFARANRRLMMVRVKELFFNITRAEFDEDIDIHHNYASFESHYGKAVIVHRKGAISAKAVQAAIVPGSQGTSSYIVEGLGNPASFMSCAHGAGRRMSRHEAIRKLDLEAEIKKMDDKGIVHGMRNRSDLDEASSAYKDIDEVMDAQKDLVKIKVKLDPIMVLKG